MITNLVAIVATCFVTNVSEHFPEEWVVARNLNQESFNCIMEKCVVQNPKIKSVVTDVFNVRTFYISNIGNLSVSNLISSTTNYFELHNDWLPTTNSFKSKTDFPFN